MSSEKCAGWGFFLDAWPVRLSFPRGWVADRMPATAHRSIGLAGCGRRYGAGRVHQSQGSVTTTRPVRAVRHRASGRKLSSATGSGQQFSFWLDEPMAPVPSWSAKHAPGLVPVGRPSTTLLVRPREDVDGRSPPTVKAGLDPAIYAAPVVGQMAGTGARP